MKIYLGFLLASVFYVSLAQDQIESIGLKEYNELVRGKSDRLKIVNFWATWCKPCVEELPYIEEIHTAYAEKPVKVILVSLDFPKQIESKLIPFLEKHQLKSTLRQRMRSPG